MLWLHIYIYIYLIYIYPICSPSPLHPLTSFILFPPPPPLSFSRRRRHRAALPLPVAVTGHPPPHIIVATTLALIPFLLSSLVVFFYNSNPIFQSPQIQNNLMSSSQSSMADDEGWPMTFTPPYCHCHKVATIRIVKDSHWATEERLFYKCDVCGFYSRCKPTGGWSIAESTTAESMRMWLWKPVDQDWNDGDKHRVVERDRCFYYYSWHYYHVEVMKMYD